jgi:hypothetical protein
MRMKHLLFIVILSAIQLSHAQSLDKLLVAPTKTAESVGSINPATNAHSSDDDLRRRVDNIDQINRQQASTNRTISEGKRCTSNCYQIVSTNSNSLSIKCLIGIRSGSIETVFKFKDSSNYQVNGAGSFKTLQDAARFVCRQ